MIDAPAISKVYAIGPFELDTAAGVLTRDGIPISLGARAGAVLAVLADHANQYVPKSGILDAAWPGVVVEEANLAVQISAIRRVLAQAPGGEHWVETLARRGYRFVGPVRALPGTRSRADAPEARRNNLPAPLTSFVGRERELVEIKRLLPGKRLVTLVGVGGMGKTRLALQVAGEALDAYRDGAWLVGLGAIADPALVPSVVAHALDVQEKAGTPLIQTLCTHLSSRQLLLILDNCEHLLDACAKLVDALLRATAETTVIATSREPLEVEGEQMYALAALSLPNPEASCDVIARSEAVQLFVERAQRQQLRFELTAARAPLLAQLCIHLDGIPLALELAAARVRTLSIEQIAARLDDRFRLLTSDSRSVLPRQQTLRATLDWSYDLLSEHERAVLRRLGLFAGGFALEAASAAASDDTLDEYAVIDVLSQLVARSLVIADTFAARARYRLLETTRAYALEKLDEAGERNLVQRRQAKYLLDLFERAPNPWLYLPDDQWCADHLPELDNLRAALDWSLGRQGDVALGIALAGASAVVWAQLSLPHEGARRVDAAISRVQAQVSSPGARARLWVWLGLLRAMVAPTEALGAFERAVELYREIGDSLGLGYSLMRMAGRLARVRSFDAAERSLAEAYPLLTSTGSSKLMGDYFTALGFLRLVKGQLASARASFEKALPIYRNLDSAGNQVVNVLSSLADLTWMLGDLDAALNGFREAAALLRCDPLPEKRLLGIELVSLAGVHTERGELARALAAAREGLPLLQETECAWSMLDHLALRALYAGKIDNAARIAGYQDAMFASKQTPRQPNEARARECLQRLLREKLKPAQLQRFFVDGASMTEARVCLLALEG